MVTMVVADHGHHHGGGGDRDEGSDRALEPPEGAE